MRRWIWPVLLVGCTDGGDFDACLQDAEVEAYVISSLSFARRDGDIVDGFDMDGLDSGAGEAGSCGHADLESSWGATGVDNNFSAVVPVLELTEAVAAESLVEQSISSGELLVTMEMGVESWLGDTCAPFTLGRAEGVPLVASSGAVLDAQTLARSTTIDAVDVEGTVEDGVLTARGLEFNLPLDVLNAELDFQVTRGQFRMRRRWDGKLVGVMGGVIPIRQITEILERGDVMLGDFVPVVEGLADVQDEDGNCSLLSLAFEIEATPIYLVEP